MAIFHLLIIRLYDVETQKAVFERPSTNSCVKLKEIGHLFARRKNVCKTNPRASEFPPRIFFRQNLTAFWTQDPKLYGQRGIGYDYIGTGSKISREIGVACWKFSKKSENSSLSYPRAQGSLARTLSRPHIPRSWIKNKTVFSVVKKQQPFAFETKLHLFPSNEKNSKHFRRPESYLKLITRTNWLFHFTCVNPQLHLFCRTF